MIFQHTHKQVMDGSKTQTRRVVGDTFEAQDWNGPILGVLRPIEPQPDGQDAKWVWRLGNTYAVQPSRTSKAIGRIRITAIRRERLQEISEEDAKAEGLSASYWDSLPSYKARVDPNHICTMAFADLWTTIHKPPNDWAGNPSVWVLEFERV